VEHAASAARLPAGEALSTHARPSPAEAFSQQAAAPRLPGQNEGVEAVSVPSASERPMQTSLQPAMPLVAPDLTAIVQQQLEALATQTYVWQGLAWPGQTMRWEIDEDAGQRPESDENPSPSWQTRLVLDMPSLGEVRAALRLTGGEVMLTLSAVTDSSAERLSESSADLRAQLQSAGLNVSGLTVGRHGEPG
jgi:hypothetical protein